MNWVEDLLDLGVGDLAVKHLRRLSMKVEKSYTCHNCGYVLRKWAVECPVCREEIR